MDDKVFTHLEMEAALCVWEQLLEWTGSNSPWWREDWAKLRDQIGTVELRHSSYVLGRWCLEVYDKAKQIGGEDVFDGHAYDWEVIPAILLHVEIEANGRFTIEPDVDETAVKVIDDFDFCEE